MTHSYAVAQCFVILFVFLCTLYPFDSGANEIAIKDIARKDVDVKVAFHFKDEVSKAKANEIMRLTSSAFSIYTDIFGGLPRDLAGREYNDIAIHVRHGSSNSGEADPKFISLVWNENKTFGYYSWQMILVHEIFHLWNAESIRYSDGKEQWFNEGVTEFYTYKTAHQLGLINSSELFSLFSMSMGNYLSSSGLGDISMRNAGLTNKSKFQHYFLIYSGGTTVALMLDYQLRASTNGARSMDDLMKWLYETHPRHKTLYTLKDIKSGLNNLSKLDFSDFLRKYVDGTDVLSPNNVFSFGDARWAFEFKQSNKNDYIILFNTLGIE